MSKSQNEKLVITNKKVIDFYNKNKHIDVDKVNLMYVELLENISSASLENPSIVNEITKSLMEQNKDINKVLTLVTLSSEVYKNELTNLKNVYTNVNDNIRSEMEHIKLLLSNMSSSIVAKMYETKDVYVNEVKNTLKMNENDTLLNISGSLDKQSQLLSDKIQIIVNDIVPKSQTMYIDNIIKQFKEETKELVTNNSSDVSLDKISLIIESKSNNMINNIQDQLLKYILMTEDRLTTNLNNIKDISSKNNTVQDKMNDELTNYLNKYKKSAGKGEISEDKLYNMLCENYPSAEIVNTTGKKGMGDMLLKRKDKNMVLFENKNYNSNVNKDEVDKFLRDVSLNKSHGIMLSQQSGIVGKENYQIDIHDNNILVYIHNVDNESYKINLAVNIIDLLSNKLTNMNDKQTTIPNELLSDLNNEFQTFVIQKDKIITSLKDYYKRSLEQITEINLPNLELFLSNYYANNKKNLLICELCKKYETDNLKSLARHKYSCKNKKEITPSDSSSESETKKEPTEIVDTKETKEPIQDNVKTKSKKSNKLIV
jgi:hypothetical protein